MAPYYIKFQGVWTQKKSESARFGPFGRNGQFFGPILGLKRSYLSDSAWELKMVILQKIIWSFI